MLVRPDPSVRARSLLDWTAAPAARVAHPREDYLMPLLVAAGAGGDDPALRVYHEDAFMGAVALSSFRFGDSVVLDALRT